jgi:SSS family transporter
LVDDVMPLGWLDIAVLAVYFAAILAVGLWCGRGERSTHDYFLGGRRQHWFVVGLSIIATEVSALTFLIVPGRSFASDCWYLQMYFGALIGRLLIVFLLLPAFYGGAVTTVYEYLGRRFGPWTRTTASLMFFASRIVGSGIRLLAASMALSIVFGWRLEWVVFGAAGVAIAYTTFGGIKAIIWTDALQAIVFVGGGIAALVFLFLSTPGSWIDNLRVVHETGKLHTFDWRFDFNYDRAFWVLLIHATFQNMAALGTDQDLTQRMLTCPDLRRGQRSLLFNAALAFPVVCLFLLIGALLHSYYQTGPPVPPPVGEMGAQDRVFTHFIATALPVGCGLKGLLVAGILAAAMSSLDSALGALSSCAVTDFYRPYVRPRASEAHYVWIARCCTFLFGMLVVSVALAFAESEQLLEDAFGWVGLIFGGMLGVFLLGVTTRARGSDRTNTLAMASSVALLAALKFYQERAETVYVAWPWWIVIGTVWTYVVGVSFRTRRNSE